MHSFDLVIFKKLKSLCETSPKKKQNESLYCEVITKAITSSPRGKQWQTISVKWSRKLHRRIVQSQRGKPDLMRETF